MAIFSLPPLVQTCPHCGLKPERWANDCPRCGRTITSPERIRHYGRGMVTLCGMGMVLVTVVMLAMGRAFLRGEDVGLLAILGSVQLFCLVGIGAGVWAMRTGRQNMPIVYTLFGITGVILLLAAVYQVFGL